MNRYLILLPLLAVLLAGCMPGRHFKSPEMPLPDTFAAGESDSLALADEAWWDFYADSALRALIERTLANNRDLKVAVQRIRELQQLNRMDRASQLPSLSGELAADHEHEEYSDESVSNDAELDLKLHLNWELDLWGNLRWVRRESLAEYLASVEAERVVQMTLIAEVATAYFELTALDSELAIVRETYRTRQEGVRMARLRFEGGLTSETAYQQAQVELASTATHIPDLERRIALKESEIALLAGELPHTITRGEMPLDSDLPRQLALGIPSDLLKRRPDIRRAELELRAAHAAVGVAYADRFPRINFRLSGGLENGAVEGLFKAPYAYASGALTSPIFAFGKKKARYRAAQEAFVAEQNRYEQTVLTAFREVNDAVVTYAKAREAARSLSELERAARKYVDLARLQYINDVILYIDVLDAQRKYFDAQIDLSNAVRDEHLALVALYKALGGGWTE